MALGLFLDNTAVVTRDVVTNDNGIQKKTKTTVYSSIDCHIYQSRGSDNDDTLSVNTKYNRWNCITAPSNVNIKQGDYMAVSDPVMGAIGTYQVIDQPKANRLISGAVDSIQFSIKML